jgi:hypothetical protein
MLINVLKSNKVWTSPDGNISIWDIEDADGQKWQTRSQKIADALGQTLDCTTTVSKSNKTYLVQTPKEGSPGFSQAAQSHVPGSGGQLPNETIIRLEKAVESLERIADRFSPTAPTAPAPDVVPKTVNEQQLDDFFGGDIVDDIN